MIYLRSAAVGDHNEQRHTGVPFAGHVSLAPVLPAKADAFRGAIDGSVEFLSAEQASEHLVSMIKRAIEARAALLSRLNDALNAGRRYVGDLRKAAKEGVSSASIAAQSVVYSADLSAAISSDVSCSEARSAQFVAASLDLIAFDPSPLKAGLSELRDTDAAIEAARANLREINKKVRAAGDEAAARAEEERPVVAIPPSVLTELALLRSEAVAIGARVGIIIDQLRHA